MSNGGRCSSASPATTNTSAAGACQSSHQGRQASPMPTSESVPAAMAALLAASTSGSSYASSCAADRIAPSRAYLFALDQPAMRVPSTPTALAASTKSSPASRSAPTRRGDSGSAVIATRYGRSATAGASRKTGASAAAGTISSFCANLTPSASSCAQPWNPPAYIGPSRPCMCAITLCSVWPTSSGRTRKARTTTTARSTISRAVPESGIAGLLDAGGTGRRRALTGLPCRSGGPGAGDVRGRGWRGLDAGLARAPHRRIGDAGRERLAAARCGAVRVGLARLLRARPRLARAGRQHERLAQRGALEAVGQQQRPQPVPRAVVEAVEGDAEHLEGLALVPGGAGPYRGEARDAQVGVRHPGAKDHSPDPGAARGAPTRARGVGHVQDDVDARGLGVGQVDRGEPVEEVHPGGVAGQPGRVDPALPGHVDERGAGGVRAGGIKEARRGLPGSRHGLRPLGRRLGLPVARLGPAAHFVTRSRVRAAAGRSLRAR